MRAGIPGQASAHRVGVRRAAVGQWLSQGAGAGVANDLFETSDVPNESFATFRCGCRTVREAGA